MTALPSLFGGSEAMFEHSLGVGEEAEPRISEAVQTHRAGEEEDEPPSGQCHGSSMGSAGI